MPNRPKGVSITNGSAPFSMESDSLYSSPVSGTLTSNKCTLSYRATLSPWSLYIRQAALTFLSSSATKGMVPPISQTACFFAISAIKLWITPLPSCSRISTLSNSLTPMKAKFSGKAINFAPAFTASTINFSASIRFPAT